MNVSLMKRIWNFIWNDDSIFSWIANIVLAFILIKFIVYPALGFILCTSFPIVAVVSGSMEHKASFDSWWDAQCCANQQCTIKRSQSDIYGKWKIGKETYTTFSFTSGFNKGDIMVLDSPKNARIGDVIVFMAEGRVDPIIHRLVDIKTVGDKTFYSTQGDNNCGATADFEKDIPQSRLLGKAYFKIPLLGWLKILFVRLITMMGLI